MSNDYYTSTSLVRNTQAKAEDINTRTQAIEVGFDKLPTPYTGVAYAEDTGVANTYVVTLYPTPTSLVDGLRASVKISALNTGATTLNVNSLGAKPVVTPSGTPLVGGEIVAGGIYEFVYDGTEFQLNTITTVIVPLLDEDNMASNSATSAPSQQSLVTYDAAQIATHAAVTATHGATGAVVGTTNTQTLSNKTLTSPAISTVTVGAETVTLPTATDTLVGKATTDTLTNKSISGATNTISNISPASTVIAADQRLLGNIAGTAQSAVELTASQVRTLINVEDAADSVKTVLTTTGDTAYASAANTVARLAIGSANNQLFTNATGTLPEWANGMKVVAVNFDLSDATGTFNITGFGFKPSAAVILFSLPASIYWSVGVYGGGAKDCLFWNGVSSVSVNIAHYSSGAGTQQFTISAEITDGFTIANTKSGSPTGTSTFMILGIR